MEHELRDKLIQQLQGKGAHMTFGEAARDFPETDINTHPTNVPYSFWHILEHIRRTQRDILDYIEKSDYSEPKWPDDYWPERSEQTNISGWNATLQGFQDDNLKLQKIVEDRTMTETVPSNPEHTILREILIVCDHTSYHLGEFAILRQVVGNWPQTRR